MNFLTKKSFKSEVSHVDLRSLVVHPIGNYYSTNVGVRESLPECEEVFQVFRNM